MPGLTIRAGVAWFSAQPSIAPTIGEGVNVAPCVRRSAGAEGIKTLAERVFPGKNLVADVPDERGRGGRNARG